MSDFEKALFGKCYFPSEKVLRPNASAMRGIRLGYPDGTRAIFWFTDKKYFIREDPYIKNFLFNYFFKIYLIIPYFKALFN
jgi:hypothetical protein